MSVVEGGDAAVAEAAFGADDAGAGADDHRVPVKAVDGGVDPACDRDRLALAAIGRAGADAAAEQPPLAQLRNVAAERSRQRPSPRLHVADLQAGSNLGRRPG